MLLHIWMGKDDVDDIDDSHAWMDGYMDGWIYGCLLYEWIHGWMDGWIYDGCIYGWITTYMDDHTISITYIIE